MSEMRKYRVTRDGFPWNGALVHKDTLIDATSLQASPYVASGELAPLNEAPAVPEKKPEPKAPEHPVKKSAKHGGKE